MKITEQYLKENNACNESYPYLRKKKLLGKDNQVMAKALYNDKRYGWCFWLLYRTTFSAKAYVWGLILFSLLLSGISLNFSLNYEPGIISAVAAVAAVAVAVAVAAADVARSEEHTS